jgi:hypothetical protein
MPLRENRQTKPNQTKPQGSGAVRHFHAMRVRLIRAKISQALQKSPVILVHQHKFQREYFSTYDLESMTLKKRSLTLQDKVIKVSMTHFQNSFMSAIYISLAHHDFLEQNPP